MQKNEYENLVQEKWQWDKIVNTDFSGVLTVEGFHNRKNDVVYAEDSVD